MTHKRAESDPKAAQTRAVTNHVWSYDFVTDRTHDGRAFSTLNIIDEYTRECLASLGRSLKTEDVLACLTGLFCSRSVPVHLRSDNGSEFANQQIRTWLSELGVKILFIEPGSPWENGYIESFNGRFRNELLNGKSSTTCKKPKSSSNSGERSTIPPDPIML